VQELPPFDFTRLLKQFAQPAAQLLLLRYTQALIAQMTQTAICIRYHSVNPI